MARRQNAGGRGQPRRGRHQGPETARPASIEGAIDTLYQLPLVEFTAARNALAGRLKKAGRAEEAQRVKGLAKPSTVAWTVNQLYWKKRDAFDRLIATGERFRQAQASQLAGKSADIRGPLQARRTALSELANLAAALLRQTGSTASPDTMRRVTTTLEALSTYGSLPEAPRAGRLVDEVDPPGFETLAALVPRVGTSRAAGPSRVIPFQHSGKPEKKSKRKLTPDEDARQAAEERKATRAAAVAAVQQAERELQEARRRAQQAEEALKKAAARAKEAEQAKADAEQRLEKAAAAADLTRQDARRIAADAEEAAEALEDAERALEKAARDLKRLDD